jgi:CelD/BcsL family acetyltransferase involved in cellulose biosynthesis
MGANRVDLAQVGQREDQCRGGRRDGLTVVHGIHAVEREWEALARRLQAPPFSYPGWYASWWSAFGRGRLEIVCLRRAGELVGLLPLCRDGQRVSSPTNWHSPSFAPLAVDEATERMLLDAAFALPARSVELDFVAADAGLERCATRRAAAGAICWPRRW